METARNILLGLVFLAGSNFSWSQTSIAEINTLIENFEFQQAKEIAQNELNKTQEMSSQKAELLELIGNTEMRLGEYEKALDAFTKSKEIWIKKDKQHQYANTLSLLGIANWKLGNIETGYELLLECVAIQETLNNQLEIANAYNNIGLILSERSPERALNYYQKALKIYLNLGDKSSDQYLITKNNIAIIQRKLGNSLLALELFNETLTSLKNQDKPNQSQKAFTKVNIAQTYLEMELLDSAAFYFDQALSNYQLFYGSKHPEIASLHNNISYIHLQKNDYKKALEQNNKALNANLKEAKNEYFDRLVQIELLKQRANIYITKHQQKSLSIKDIKQALNHLNTCDKLVSEHRNFVFNESDKIEYGKLAKQVYDQMIECLLILRYEPSSLIKNYNNQIHEVIEKSKSATLQATIQDTKAKSFGRIPSDLIQQEKQIVSTISFIEQEIIKSTNDDDIKNLQSKLFSIKIKHQDFILKLEKNYPDYYELKYASPNYDPAVVQQNMTDSELILNYYISDRTNELIVVKLSKSKIKVENHRLIERFSKWIIRYKNSIYFSSIADFKASASTLYTELMLQQLPKSTQKLIIIPTADLNTIPFEALLYKKPEKETKDFSGLDYLINKYEISYHFSATLWNSRSRKRLTAPTFNGFAPINFSNHENMADLPATASEIEKIDSLFNSKNLNSNTFLRDDAHEKTLGELNQQGILHLATHGIINSKKPEQSRLLFSSTSNSDGKLYTGEIYNQRFEYDLVSLSACNTGRGRVSNGEGVLGITRALIYAGANNLVVSYWSVDDQSTSEFMVDFYCTYLGGKSYSASIREAKLNMIKMNDYHARPYYWAPFFLIGS